LFEIEYKKVELSTAFNAFKSRVGVVFCYSTDSYTSINWDYFN